MRIAFVLGRYGRSILGGAETLARGMAQEAVRQGWEVEIWTTCARDNETWRNHYPPGASIDNGITVRRFAVDEWDAERYHSLNHYARWLVEMNVPQHYDWLISGPHSSQLNHHVKTEAAKLDAVVTIPYLGSITYDAAILAADKAIVWPCLHKESFAHMEPFRLLLGSVSGVVFNSPEEAAFAEWGLGLNIERKAVIGAGVTESQINNQAINERARPYLLYLGRLDVYKNVEILYEFVRRYVAEGGDLQLVVAGEGACKPPESPEFDYLGHVSEAEKKELIVNALAVCQPSFNESFSLVIMESWLANRPVLVWSRCDVTRGHVQRSKGGLWFGGFGEFEGAVNWLKENGANADRMGRNGHKYVQQNFTWEHVFSRFQAALRDWAHVEDEVNHGD